MDKNSREKLIATITKLQKDVNAFKKEKEDLVAEKDQMEMKVANAEKDYKMERENWSKERHQLEMKLSSLVKDDNEFKVLQLEVDGLENQLELSQESLASKNIGIKLLEKANDKMRLHIHEEKGNMKRRNEEFFKTNEENENRLSKLRQEITKIKFASNCLETDNKALKGAVKAKENELKFLKEKHEKWTDQQEEFQKDIRNKLASSSKDLDEVRTYWKEWSNKLEKKEEDNFIREYEIKTRDDFVTKLYKENAKLQARIERVTKQRDNFALGTPEYLMDDPADKEFERKSTTTRFDATLSYPRVTSPSVASKPTLLQNVYCYTPPTNILKTKSWSKAFGKSTSSTEVKPEA